ncbi:hypothetical protein KA037_05385 [Patescibacteria group bacterium]|nr:hypothetical protein [Patescibacteria group bacterium]MBP7842056.1 hypothetical protein [Patescibacteria group bacterium]
MPISTASSESSNSIYINRFQHIVQRIKLTRKQIIDSIHDIDDKRKVDILIFS